GFYRVFRVFLGTDAAPGVGFPQCTTSPGGGHTASGCLCSVFRSHVHVDGRTPAAVTALSVARETTDRHVASKGILFSGGILCSAAASTDVCGGAVWRESLPTWALLSGSVLVQRPAARRACLLVASRVAFRGSKSASAKR